MAFKRTLLKLSIIFVLLFSILGVVNVLSDTRIKFLEKSSAIDFKQSNGDFLITSHGTIYYEKYASTNTLNKNIAPIVLLHGFGGNLHTWRKITSECSRITDCYAIDLKGFGLSKELIDTNLSQESQADMVLESVDKLGIDRFSLVGHSMGGAVAEIASIKAGERIDKLVLVAPTDLDDAKSGISFKFSEFLTNPLYAVNATEENVKKQLQDAYYEDSLVKEEDVKSYFTPYLVKDSHLVANYLLSSSQTKKYYPQDISVKTLIIQGEKDTWVKSSHSEDLRNLIANSDIKIIPLVGHLPMEESPNKFIVLVQNFIVDKAN